MQDELLFYVAQKYRAGRAAVVKGTDLEVEHMAMPGWSAQQEKVAVVLAWDENGIDTVAHLSWDEYEAFCRKVVELVTAEG
jgi:hypothetical protein